MKKQYVILKIAITYNTKSMKPAVAIDSKKIFVAGGTGFLGSRLVRKLKILGMRYCTTSLSLGVDFRDKRQVDKYFEIEKPNVVINCATFIGGIKFGLDHEGEIIYNNSLMSTNLIEASRKYNVKRFINPISNCSYPDISNKKFKETEWWNGPLNRTVLGYGMIRKLSWVNLFAYRNQYKLDSQSFLIPNMYGPGDHFDEVRSHALGALIKRIFAAKKQREKQVVIWGTGKPIREWIYVEDCVDIFIKSLSFETSIQPINIGRGEGVSIARLANLIKQATGYKGKLVFDKTRPDGAPYKIMNVTVMKKKFNWFPKINVETGIKKTVKWYYKSLRK